MFVGLVYSTIEEAKGSKSNGGKRSDGHKGDRAINKMILNTTTADDSRKGDSRVRVRIRVRLRFRVWGVPGEGDHAVERDKCVGHQSIECKIKSFAESEVE